MRRLALTALVVVAALLPPQTRAQNTITTVAGGALPNNVPNTGAGLEGVYGVVRDATGNLYVITDVGVIYKATPSGAISIYAGNITGGYTGDGGLATAATLDEPFAGALDANGNLYFSDSQNCVIRKITASTGIITTVVGNGNCGYSGDGLAATSATLNFPQGVAIDPLGNIFIVDYNNDVVRRVDGSTNVITTFAGNGNVGYTGDGGAATQATLNFPVGVATDTAGNVYIADAGNNVVRFVNATTNIITTVAGNGNPGYAGDGGPAIRATLNYPAALAVDSAGNLYIADTDNAVIRKVDTKNTINTIIGDHAYGFGGDGGPALQATLTNPFGLAVDSAGDVWVADYWNNRIRMYAAATAIFNTVVGNGSVYDGLAATSGSLYFPRGPALDSQGNLYITDTNNNRIRVVNASTGIITTVAGTNVPCAQPTLPCGDGGQATAAAFFGPHSVNLDPTDTFMNIADSGDSRLRQVNTGTGIISTIAGTGVAGFSGDGGPATAAQINSPRAPNYDSLGNLYFVDTSNHRVRKIDKTTGIITTVVGSGGFAAESQGCDGGGYSGDGGPATSATLHCPLGMAIDANDNLFIADYLNNVIRKVDAKTQIITTVVGTGTPGYTGDNGPATASTLNLPDRVSVNGAGNLFISDTGNNVVRRVDALTQIITTFAGSGAFGFSGDGGPALSAALAQPTGVVVTDSGDLYLGDLLNNRIRKVTLNSAVTFSPATAAFGNQAINSTSNPLILTVTNSGDAPLAIADVAVASESGAFALSGNTCGATVAVGAQCALSLTFSPASFGALTGTLTLTDNAPGSPQAVTLTGTAVNGSATVTVSPTSLTFASQTVNSTSPAQNVTVTNTGTGPVTFTGFSITGQSSGSFALATSGSSPCNPTGTLAANASCAIGVTFTPTTVGEIVATLSIADTAAGSPQLVSLNGTGNNSPVTITISPGGSATGSATPGGTAFFGLQITGAPGVIGTVQLGCTPSSPTITCNVIPSSIALTGKPIEVAFGIQTYCQGATNTGFAPGMPGTWPAGGIALLLLSLGLGALTWAMQRNRRVALTFALLMLVALGTAACGSLAKGPNGATPPGTYSLTLTTTVNGQTQTLPNFLTLVVE
jgi:sugar lactone lactonase YvrE